MSDEDNKPPRTDVGYRRPPVERQYQPGQSGNKRGRPRSRTPGVMPVELTRAILKVGNTEVVMNTPEGKKKVPGYQAVFTSLLRSAMSGKFHSARIFLEYYGRAVKDYATWNPQFQIDDRIEKDLLSGSDPRGDWPEASDYMRRNTRTVLSDKIDPDYPRRKDDPRRR